MARTLEPSSETKSVPARVFSARAGIILIGVCAVACLLALAHFGQILDGALHSEAGRYDFSSYYAAGAALRANPRADIYSQAVLNSAGAGAKLLVFPPLPYTYPPLFAIVLSPFTVISFRVLSRAWLALGFALWLGVIPLFAIEIAHLLRPALTLAPPTGEAREVSRVRRLLMDPVAWIATALAAWLTVFSTPAAQTMSTGQVNFLVLVPLALVPLLTRRRHERWVGIAVAVAAMLKFTPALLIVYLALRRRWEALIAALVTLAALAVLSALVVGPHSVVASIPQALRVGAGDAGQAHNQALFAPALTELHAGSSSALALIAKALTALGALALGVWLFQPAQPSSARRFDADAENVGYAVALCAMVLISPTAWVHHYVWILPAAAVVIGFSLRHALASPAAFPRRRAVLEMTAALVAILGLTLALPSTWDSDPAPAVRTFLGLRLWPIMLEMRPLATLLLVVLLCAWYGRAKRAAVAAAPS